MGISAVGLSLPTSIGWTLTAFAEGNPGVISPERHLLNRLTWGVRPQDIKRLQQKGKNGYIDWQLDYEAIDDPLVDQFVATRPVLALGPDEVERIASENYDFVLKTQYWARIYRAVNSERQLYERMVEFWTDHFNVPVTDLISEKLIDDREVVRKNALGHFRDLLFASAQSPAMLHYLNNADSNKAHPNENYAREVMELHTLGVDGGYTEHDVREVARAFTGWKVRNNQFYFATDDHDDGEKDILGHHFPAGRGIEDGLQVLDILATHPSTARFIALKLARRFVTDQPPPSLIDSAADVFASTDGDLRRIMRHILTSDEFQASAGQKFRRPLEAIVAYLRVLAPGIELQNPDPLVSRLEELGQVPFRWNLPNGYPDVAGAWINSSGLLSRWNTAIELALAGDGYFDGVVVNLDQVIPSVGTVAELVDATAARILGIELAPADRDLLLAFVAREGGATLVTGELRRDKLPALVGLLLSSRYFHWV